MSYQSKTGINDVSPFFKRFNHLEKMPPYDFVEGLSTNITILMVQTIIEGIKCLHVVKVYTF